MKKILGEVGCCDTGRGNIGEFGASLADLDEAKTAIETALKGFASKEIRAELLSLIPDTATKIKVNVDSGGASCDGNGFSIEWGDKVSPDSLEKLSEDEIELFIDDELIRTWESEKQDEDEESEDED